MSVVLIGWSVNTSCYHSKTTWPRICKHVLSVAIFACNGERVRKRCMTLFEVDRKGSPRQKSWRVQKTLFTSKRVMDSLKRREGEAETTYIFLAPLPSYLRHTINHNKPISLWAYCNCIWDLYSLDNYANGQDNQCSLPHIELWNGNEGTVGFVSGNNVTSWFMLAMMPLVDSCCTLCRLVDT